MKRAALTLALGLSLAACQSKVVDTPPVPPPPPLKVIANPSPSMPDGHPALKDLAIGSRGPRRMSVDQLERSLDEIGGLPAGTVKLPVDLAVTLGKPDFKRVTEEQLQPTPLFMKFMLDLSGFFCPSLATAEPMRPVDVPGKAWCTDPASTSCQKFYTRFETVDDNIRYQILRFTGIEGADADGYLARLKVAYQDGAQSATVPLAGYQAVCASLFTSPEFLLY